MKHKRVVAFIVILALIISALPVVSLAEDTQPAFEVIGSTIKNDNKFFELTMKVTPGSKGFFSAGMTLKYDKSVITPVAWDSAGTAVPMESCNNWQNVAAVPAVCPTEISGKTALAYEDADSGYLYISAETALPVSALPNGGKILTVRFKYAGSDDTAIVASKQKVIDGFANGQIVSLAPDDISAASPAGQMVFYGAGDEDETEYYYTADNDTTAGIKHDELLTEPPVFTLIQDADSANTGGGSDASNFAALVFFDWDESTLLGSMVVDGSMTAEEITEQTNSFAKTLMPLNMEWSEENASEITTYDPEYPLTSHNGYTFGKWIDFNSEAPTVYGEAVNVTGANIIDTIFEPDSPNYYNISNGLILKAAYIANTKMDTSTVLTSITSRQYTISTDADPNAGYYGRFGTGDAYSVKVRITRVNNTANPIHRPRNTAVRVKYKISGAQLYALVSANNVDEQIVEAVLPANAEDISFEVIDNSVSNWAAAAAPRSNPYSVDASDFVFYGTVNYINQQAEDSSATAPASTIFTEAQISITAGNVAGTSSTGAAALRRQAFTNIRTAQNEKAVQLGNDKKYLSHDEMQYAVENGHYAGV